MKKYTRYHFFAILLAVALLVFCGCADNKSPLDSAVAYLVKNTETLAPASIGGDYTAMALAQTANNGSLIDEYKNNLLNYVAERKGILHSTRYTEYSRISIGAAAVGLDPKNIGGYDIITPLLDFEKVTSQGINGAAWALIALDTCNVTDNIGDIRLDYVEYILASQNVDGSFGRLSGSEIDITAMCLRALAGYTSDASVAAACERGIDFIAASQSDSGTFLSPYGESSETISQVLLALCALDMGLDDPRFDANTSLTDALLAYQNPDGGFSHLKGSKSDRLATEQAVLALIALNGKTSDLSCKVTVECTELINCEALKESKRELVPDDGIILSLSDVTFSEGETVFDVLTRVLKENKIHFEYSEVPMYNSVYIEGIGNLYEFDAGSTSGWQYAVNGEYPGVGCSQYQLADGDEIVWSFLLSINSK